MQSLDKHVDRKEVIGMLFPGVFFVVVMVFTIHMTKDNLEISRFLWRHIYLLAASLKDAQSGFSIAVSFFLLVASFLPGLVISELAVLVVYIEIRPFRWFRRLMLIGETSYFKYYLTHPEKEGEKDDVNMSGEADENNAKAKVAKFFSRLLRKVRRLLPSPVSRFDAKKEIGMPITKILDRDPDAMEFVVSQLEMRKHINSYAALARLLGSTAIILFCCAVMLFSSYMFSENRQRPTRDKNVLWAASLTEIVFPAIRRLSVESAIKPEAKRNIGIVVLALALLAYRLALVQADRFQQNSLYALRYYHDERAIGSARQSTEKDGQEANDGE